MSEGPRIPASGLAAQGRLAYLDGLRGVAAMAVAMFHIYRMTPVYEPLRPFMPLPLHLYAAYGGLGVIVFFVLSGFVIPYSVRRDAIDWRFVGRFMLRRSIRLDPAYWLTLVTATLLALTLHAIGQDVVPPPTLGQFAAHLVYLQGILGYRQIVSVFWTLAVEIQLYGVLLLLLAFAQRTPARALKAAPFVALFVGSAWLMMTGHESSRWFAAYWSFFFFGTVTFWVLDHRADGRLWWAVAAVLVAMTIVSPSHLDPGLALLTGVTIYVAGRTGNLRRWLNVGWLQYLGRISYSLYLTHFIGANAVKFGVRLTGTGVGWAATWVVVAVGISIGTAELLHRFVEVPTMKLAKSRDPIDAIRGALFGRRARRAAAAVEAPVATGPITRAPQAPSVDNS